MGTQDRIIHYFLEMSDGKMVHCDDNLRDCMAMAEHYARISKHQDVWFIEKEWIAQRFIPLKETEYKIIDGGKFIKNPKSK